MWNQFATVALGAVILSACGGGDNARSDAPKTEAIKTEMSEGAPKTSQPARPAASTSVQGAATEDGAALIAKSDCSVCHKPNQKLIGPSYAMLAERYEPTEDNLATLSQKVIHGGSGNWGPAPMAPHANLSPDQAKAMVKYMLETGADQ